MGGLGRGRNQERGGRNESSLGKGNLAVGFECMLGARIHGSEVGAELGTKICGAELGAVYSGAEVLATSTPLRMPCCARPGTSEPRSVAPRRVTSASGVLTLTSGSKYEFKSSRG